VCKHGNQWRAHHRIQGTGYLKGFVAEMWPIGLTLDVEIEKGENVQNHGVMTVAGFSD
jgi:hypothetical protein